MRRATGWGLVLVALAVESAAAQGPAVQVFEVTAEPGPVRDLVGEEVAATPGHGRYFVLDERGLRCEARLVRARALSSALVVAGTPPHQVELRAVGPAPCGIRRLEDGHLVAVGPLASPPTRGRLMALGLARAGAPASTPRDRPGAALPPGVAEDRIELAVDLDGDRAVDLLALREQRALPSTSPGAFRAEHRRETWSRAASGWSSTASATWTVEAPLRR